MGNSIPQLIQMQTYCDQFWAQLTWEKLERRIKTALSRSDEAVPLETNCPAVMDLANQIIRGLGELAIQKPGVKVSSNETFNFDQRLIILRIIEAIISEYEDWKKGRPPERATLTLRSGLRSLEQK